MINEGGRPPFGPRVRCDECACDTSRKNLKKISEKIEET